jgi:hypothetical protein
MVRWGQAPISPDHLAAARAVFSPDTYDAVLGSDAEARGEGPADGIGAFAGPAFDPARILSIKSFRACSTPYLHEESAACLFLRCTMILQAAYADAALSSKPPLPRF